MPTNLGIFFYAGKSTTGGQILFLSGQVDDRTIQKYEKEANDKSRESWLVLCFSTVIVLLSKFCFSASSFVCCSLGS
ncbi:eukaryotic peptide chain release factor GTP-binding subunit ERF3A [Trifolium repens]|nr:eukaryotic peptide chain release factor GTP-binding subunit ERF3A [Trifolium repens]